MTSVETEIKPSPLPSVGDFLFLLIMQINLFLLPNFLFAEGSTGWHLVAGDFIVNTATIPHIDLVSNTFPNKAWVAYEWLFDAGIAAIVDLGDLKLLGVLLSAAIGFLFLFIYDRTRREGAGIPLSFSLVVISVLTAMTHWHARPHLVTFWCVWIYVTTLEDFYRNLIDRKTLFLVLCPTMLLWVNCHPAFPLGFVILAMYVISAFVQTLNSKSGDDRAKYRKAFIALFALSLSLVLITFINPYGSGLHEYILSYLKGSEILVNTQEFMSPVFKGGMHPTCLEILFFAFASGLYVSRQKISMPGLMTSLVFGHMALSAVRNMPLYAIVVTSFIGRLWGRRPVSVPSIQTSTSKPGSAVDCNHTSVESLGTSGETDAVSKNQAVTVSEGAPAEVKTSFFGRLKKSLKDFELQEAQCKMHILPYGYTVFLIVVALCGGSFMGKPMLTSTFDPVFLPVETVSYIKKNHINMKRVFNMDNWGGYLRYTLGERVFMDDRADFYGLPFYAKYSRVMAVGEGWQKILDDYKIDWILFPKKSALAATLRADKNWKSVANDEASELFERVVHAQ